MSKLDIKEDITTVNQWVGRQGYNIQGIVVHSMAGYFSGSIQWFKNKDAQVSAHYCVSKDGRIALCVTEANTAWHAGNVTVDYDKAPKLLKENWGINPNFISIGIELEDEKNKTWDYPVPQYEAMVKLTADIVRRYKIPVERDYIVMHKETDPLNKSDPIGHWDHDKFISDVEKEVILGGGEEEDSEFYPHESEIVVREDVKVLYVRSEPVRRFVEKKSLIWPFHKVEQTNLSGSKQLTGGQWFRATGFVKGENIDGNPWWWVSWKGNYVWSGGTVMQPRPEDYPESIMDKTTKEVTNMEVEVLKDELRKVQETRAAELAKVDEVYRERVASLREAIDAAEAAPAEEPAEEVVEEAPAEEAPVEEAPAEEAPVEEEAPAEEPVEEPAPEYTEEEKGIIARAKEILASKGGE